MMRNKIYDDRGFSLVELGAVLLMAGTIMMLGVRFVKLYSVGQQYDTTIENVNTTFAALKEYQAIHGHYPCPADPALPPDHAEYGEEQCNQPYQGCAGYPKGEVQCLTNGSRDLDGDGNGEPVFVGVIPFRTLQEGISERGTPYTLDQRVDGYGTLISYAVTAEMTDDSNTPASPINPSRGVIKIVDENNVSLTIPDSSAHFNIFSHGNNGKGGYSSEGVLIENCFIPSITDPDGPPEEPPPGPDAAGTDVEIENCDNNDARFRKATRSLGENADYFDDISKFNVESFFPLWKRAVTADSSDYFLYNTNIGDVGVGTQFPTKKLHVVGDLKAGANIISPLYCDDADATTECMDANAIGGTPDIEAGGMVCTEAGEAAYAIGNNQFECRKVEWEVPAKQCPIHDFGSGPETTYMAGFSNLGNLVCCNKVDDNILNPALDTDCCKYNGTDCDEAM